MFGRRGVGELPDPLARQTEELLAKRCQAAFGDGIAGLLHDPQVEAEIVQGREPEAERFVHAEEMCEEGPTVARAGRAVARFVERAGERIR